MFLLQHILLIHIYCIYTFTYSNQSSNKYSRNTTNILCNIIINTYILLIVQNHSHMLSKFAFFSYIYTANSNILHQYSLILFIEKQPLHMQNLNVLKLVFTEYFDYLRNIFKQVLKLVCKFYSQIWTLFLLKLKYTVLHKIFAIYFNECC